MTSGTRKYNRLYVHIPFCSSKCDYCAFYSEISPDKNDVDAYLTRLFEEFRENAPSCSLLKSIYFGGGTPTYLSVAHLQKLFEKVDSSFQIAPDAEISIEANPDTLDKKKIETIASFCNRVSVGVQTSYKNLRSIIGRKCEEYNIAGVINNILESSVKNISCDLIYGIPAQTASMLLNDLHLILESGVKHISAYSLTFEENSILGKNKSYTESVHSEIESEMWYMLEEELKKHGILRYEISNYAENGYECRHNLEIWYGDTYLGCGPAAASFDGEIRTVNPPNLINWLKKVPPEKDMISQKYRAEEIFIMGLRTVNGWNEKTFFQRTGFNFSDFKPTIKKVENAGLIKYDTESGIIKCTETGLACWNDTALMVIEN